ncbi:hypothetical protein K2173_016558 [Erythroxylum novogranatense]|uniref:Uncharacterized protein n=1 Tax=Erythroxylum novogranatense TaxID=1862640 RepID=A0AAV8SGK5_9ROSI|nr:hypothetical protein K2173_016558 [Erythroxylum novogranatense]
MYHSLFYLKTKLVFGTENLDDAASAIDDYISTTARTKFPEKVEDPIGYQTTFASLTLQIYDYYLRGLCIPLAQHILVYKRPGSDHLSVIILSSLSMLDLATGNSPRCKRAKISMDYGPKRRVGIQMQ